MKSTKRFWQRVLGSIALVVTLTFMTACEPEIDETWKIKSIKSKSVTSTEYVETVVVRDCEDKEEKECSCSSTIGRGFSVSAGTKFNIPLPAVPELDVQATFSSYGEIGGGETLKLQLAPPGQALRYQVIKKYRTITGKAIARSPQGFEREVDYSFQASCTQSIKGREIISCDGEMDNKDAPPTAQPTDSVKDITATQDLKSAIIGVWAFSNGMTIEYTTDGKEIISAWYIPNCTYTWIDDSHIEEKGRNGQTVIWEVKLDGDSLNLIGKDLSVHLTRVKSK